MIRLKKFFTNINKVFIFLIIFVSINLTLLNKAFSQECNPNIVKPARYSQKGENIKNIQNCLFVLGYLNKNQISGIYDNNTVIAVKNFYKDYIGEWRGLVFNYKGINKLKDLIVIKKLSANELFNLYKNNIVLIKTDNSVGTGFILNNQGYILTNYHVVSSGNNIKSVLNILGKQLELNTQLISYDEINDIALLKIDYIPMFVRPIIFADSEKLEPGDKVYMLGYPFGLEGDVSLKEGIFSRKMTFENNNLLELSIEMHPGNSGSPVFNEYGRLIGIAVSKIGQGVGNILLGESLKYTIPSNTVTLSLNILKAGLSIENIEQRNKICNEIKSEINYFFIKFTSLIKNISSIDQRFSNILEYNDVTIAYKELLFSYSELMNGLDKIAKEVSDLSYDANLNYIDKNKLLSFQLAYLDIINKKKTIIRNTSIRYEYFNSVKNNPLLYSPTIFMEYKYKTEKEYQELLDALKNLENITINISKDYQDLLLKQKCPSQ